MTNRAQPGTGTWNNIHPHSIMHTTPLFKVRLLAWSEWEGSAREERWYKSIIGGAHQHTIGLFETTISSAFIILLVKYKLEKAEACLEEL